MKKSIERFCLVLGDLYGCTCSIFLPGGSLRQLCADVYERAVLTRHETISFGATHVHRGIFDF